MVTDRIIVISNGSASVELTAKPYTVEKTDGFDTLEVENVISQGFDQDGASLLNSYISPRNMEIYGQMKADTTEKMQELRDQLINICIPKKELTITHFYGGKNRVIKAVIKASPKFDFTQISVIQNYTIKLYAPNPYWSDATETLVQIANILGGFHFPLVLQKGKGVTFGIKSSSLIADVYNGSSIKIGMKFVFVANGVVKNPQLFNVNTRKYMKILCVMEAGETITVETGEECNVIRTKNGISEDYIGKVDLAGGGNTFLILYPGDNLFRYGAESGEDVLETRIIYANKYPGV